MCYNGDVAKLINSLDMRASLPKKEQRALLKKIFSKISISEAAELCNVSKRTLRDWRRAKFTMDLKILKKLCQKSQISIPDNINLKKDYWYVNKGAKKGGRAVIEKYGRVCSDEEYRKKKWYEWWEKEGKYNTSFITTPKPIKKPRYSADLAEFVGIVLGDGTISQRQITITLHRKDDKKYAKFVTNLIQKLFNVPVGIYKVKHASANNYIISRSKLVRFCVTKLGLKRGNKVKQQVDIPNWIKQNRTYSIACVRGLIDTDGSVFTHNYKVNGKNYSYKKLAFTNHSEPLRLSVFNILKNNNLNPRLVASKPDVRLDSIEDMKKYFQTIDSHNPKHLQRYSK